MSSINFFSKDNQASLRGSERAAMDIITSGFQEIIFENKSKDEILQILGGTQDLCNLYFFHHEEEKFKESFRMAMRTGMCSGLQFKLGEETINPFCLKLNTAFKMGSDPIKLMTRLHAQCEINTYVMPENFSWIIEIIENGLESGLYRQNQGWDDVLRIFKESKTPIVTSFSGDDDFPDRKNLEIDDETWHEMSYENRFDLALKELQEINMLEITPQLWEKYCFDKDISALNFQ